VIPPAPDRNLEEAHKYHNVNLGIRGEFGHDDQRLHLKLEVVDPLSGRVLDRRTLDEDIRNITSLQRQPVLLVWEMLRFDATPEALGELDELSTNALTACRAYVSGRGRLGSAADESELVAAAELLEQAVAEDPGYGPARLALASAAARIFATTHQQEWCDRAIGEANRSIELMGDDPQPYLVLSEVYRSEHATDQQLEALRKAASVSQTADAHLELGVAATDAELYDEAEASFQRAINLRPDSCDPHLNLGYLYLKMGRYDAAANEYRHAVRAAPLNEIALINLGAMLYYQGLRDEARTTFENAVEAGPPTVTAYSNLGTIYFEEGRFGDAAGMFSMAVDLMGDEVTAEDHTYVANHANALYWGGNRVEARPVFERAIELAEAQLDDMPGDPSVMADLAGYYAMVGNRDRGLELLEEAVRRDVRDAHVMAAIGESFEDLDDRNQAIEWIGKALEGGLETDWIDRRPSLNRLREDPRYEELVR
jgi:tetratricopeptide (TPR) repeat protein